MKRVILSVLLFITMSVNASSVRQVSINQMVEKSALVFEGSVVSVSTYSNDSGAIVTRIVFTVVDVIKGEWPNSQLPLDFLGGTLQGKTMSVSDIHYPALGEKGIYFVESTDKPMVNPLLGWDQGRFLIEKNASGNETVFTANKKPVGGLQNTPAQTFNASAPVILSTGVAKGVSVMQSVLTPQPISKDQFKQQLRDLLEPAP